MSAGRGDEGLLDYVFGGQTVMLKSWQVVSGSMHLLAGGGDVVNGAEESGTESEGPPSPPASLCSACVGPVVAPASEF